MNAYRKYGSKPFELILVHGGPGASGSLKPVAEQLSESISCIEVLNSAHTIREQIDEINQSFNENSIEKATLAGHSWGAWLSILFAGHYPERVRKLILIACPAFDAKGREQTSRTRMDRLNDQQKLSLEKLSIKLREAESKNERNAIFSRMGEIIRIADSFAPFPQAGSFADYEVFSRVWPEADKFRESGDLTAILKKMKCPVTAIHGDYDPHPLKHVRETLAKHLVEL